MTDFFIKGDEHVIREYNIIVNADFTILEWISIYSFYRHSLPYCKILINSISRIPNCQWHGMVTKEKDNCSAAQGCG